MAVQDEAERRMSTLLKLLSLTLALAVVAMLGVGLGMQQALLQPIQADDPQASFEVRPGMRFGQVTRALEERGLLHDSALLQLYARATGLQSRLQAGEYALHDVATALDLFRAMQSGRTLQYAVTLVEGWTFRQFRAALAGAEHLRQELAGLDDADVMARLGRPDEHPEGRFLPETYHYTRSQSDLDILRRAYQDMHVYLQAAWRERAADLPYETPYDALIMASIIEKETGVPDERARIAGVFVRRLRKGMRLETDPTVIYGMGERYDGNIRRRDLREDTPYNTYVHHGLTPTPIANPGKAAIDAALNPADGTALFFVARGDGSREHQFSDTYAEHRRAVQAYLERRRNGGS